MAHRMGIWIALTCLSFAHGAPSGEYESSPLSSLPRGTTLKLKAGTTIRIRPDTETLEFFSFNSDADGDGVSDHTDFCPGTPPGRAVWRGVDAFHKKCSEFEIGCQMDDPGNVRNSGNNWQLEGWDGACYLKIPPSYDDRVLTSKVALTVLHPKDTALSDEERVRFSMSDLILSTPSGLHLGIRCPLEHVVRNVFGRQTSIETRATVSKMREIFDIEIPEPIEITLR